MTVSRSGKRGKIKMRPAGRNSRVKYNGRVKAAARPGLATSPERESKVYLARHLDDCGRDVRPSSINDNIAPLTLEHGRYETVDTIYRRAFETELAPRILNRTVTVIDGWIDDDVFHRPHVRVIEYCRDLWRDIRFPRHPFFDAPDLEDRNDSFESERAKALLHRCRRLVGDYHWNVFENVVRWNEPTGVPGSRVANVSGASIVAAQGIVRDVAAAIRAIL